MSCTFCAADKDEQDDEKREFHSAPPAAGLRMVCISISDTHGAHRQLGLVYGDDLTGYVRKEFAVDFNVWLFRFRFQNVKVSPCILHGGGTY